MIMLIAIQIANYEKTGEKCHDGMMTTQSKSTMVLKSKCHFFLEHIWIIMIACRKG